MAPHEPDERRPDAVRRRPAETPADAWLDHALEDSFPASDPIAMRHVD
jgi:hypothetical protein